MHNLAYKSDTVSMSKQDIDKDYPAGSGELKIGTHLSVAKGYAALAKDAVQIGANTFQLFIRNPRAAVWTSRCQG